jgi:hypothetical protein
MEPKTENAASDATAQSARQRVRTAMDLLASIEDGTVDPGDDPGSVTSRMMVKTARQLLATAVDVVQPLADPQGFLAQADPASVVMAIIALGNQAPMERLRRIAAMAGGLSDAAFKLEAEAGPNSKPGTAAGQCGRTLAKVGDLAAGAAEEIRRRV